jgi:VWFA-related protein
MCFAHYPSLLFIAVTICAAAFPPRIGARQSQIPSERTLGPIVDFTALNADGSPIADLQPSEVEIKIGDRPRVIRQLRRVSAGEASHAAGRLPPPYGTNSDISTGRRFMIVIDQESIAAGREQLFRSAVEGLLSELTSADRTMVAALPFGGIVVPFTSDIARIRLATGRIAGQGSRTETGSDRACRTRRFLESMMGMLQAGGTEDSPQTLIVFTDGMAAPRRDAPAGLLPGMCELQIDLFRDLAEVTSRARANVYIMQPADIGIRTSLPRATIGGTSDIGSDNPLEGLEHLAGVTGGTRLALDASGTGSLLRVAKESTGYYAAELEPANGEVFNRARSVAVRISRRGVTVRARPEIVFTDTVRPSGKTRLAVPDLLSSAEAVADLPLRVGGFTVRDADGKLRVGVLVEPVDATVALASAGAILIEGNGRVAAHWHARDATERPLLGAMTAPAGRYRIRAAAIDSAGRPGAAEAEVDVGLIDVGALSLGSLLLSASRGGTTSLQLEFSTEPTARASFDIYGGSEGQRVAAVLELARDLDGPAMSTVPLALTRADAARVVATGTIPLGALPPDDYVVRGIIRLEDGTTGRVVRTLRKKTR